MVSIKRIIDRRNNIKELILHRKNLKRDAFYLINWVIKDNNATSNDFFSKKSYEVFSSAFKEL